MNTTISVLFCRKIILNPCGIHFRFKHVLRRKPVRVLSSFDEQKTPSLKEIIRDSTELLKQSRAARPGIKLPITPYVKLQPSDERYAKIFTTIKSEKAGENDDKILLEGVRLINDAIENGVKLETLLFSREETLSRIKFTKPESIKLYKVLYKTLQLWSSLENCPGIMGVFKKPTLNELKVVSEPVIPVTVLGYNIKDHRIMGSVIRNAASAGCKSVLFTKGCTNVWTQKVMRAACGAHFHIPVIDNIEWIHIQNYLSDNSSVYFIDSRTINGDYVYDKLLDSISENEDSELSDEDGSADDEPELDESETYITTKETKQLIVDKSYSHSDTLGKYTPELLRTVPYTNTSFPSSDIIVCISDQNCCEDPRAMKLGCDFGGTWLNIPTANKVIGVNSSLALPVILYEIKRQLGEEYVTM